MRWTGIFLSGFFGQFLQFFLFTKGRGLSFLIFRSFVFCLFFWNHTQFSKDFLDRTYQWWKFHTNFLSSFLILFLKYDIIFTFYLSTSFSIYFVTSIEYNFHLVCYFTRNLFYIKIFTVWTKRSYNYNINNFK